MLRFEYEYKTKDNSLMMSPLDQDLHENLLCIEDAAFPGISNQNELNWMRGGVALSATLWSFNFPLLLVPIALKSNSEKYPITLNLFLLKKKILKTDIYVNHSKTVTWLSGNCSHGRQMVCRISSLYINSPWLPQLFSHSVKAVWEKSWGGGWEQGYHTTYWLTLSWTGIHTTYTYLSFVPITTCIPWYDLHPVQSILLSNFDGSTTLTCVSLYTYKHFEVHTITILMNLKLQKANFKSATHKTKYWHHRKL